MSTTGQHIIVICFYIFQNFLKDIHTYFYFLNLIPAVLLLSQGSNELYSMDLERVKINKSCQNGSCDVVNFPNLSSLISINFLLKMILIIPRRNSLIFQKSRSFLSLSGHIPPLLRWSWPSLK